MKYLITSALPYANGPLHFGHIAGVYLPADIYTRHRKLQGKRAIHICGSDEHGVAIMLNAQKAKKDYQEYVNDWHKEHETLFSAYDIKFDFFGQTSKQYHHEETIRWFNELNSKGAIQSKEESQLQCNDCKNYLPDRFVEGTCYVCGYDKARGDECPNCGTWIEPIKLLKPVCKICGSKDVHEAKVTQWYLTLSKYHEEFRNWFKTKQHWRKTVTSFVESLSKDELVDRAITRDLDWGIDVPLPEAKGKKLYVWFDAPIGYVSNTKQYLKENNINEDYIKDWWKGKDVEISHFIGKDNIIFHTIIFPVMGMASGFINPPTEVPANQYVNLEGKQFSKSQGWYIDADQAIKDFGPDAMRYYLISLIPESSDSSYTWKGFEARVNNELANNIGNFINRSMKFLEKNWPEGLSAESFQGFFETAQATKVKTDIAEYQIAVDEFSIKKGMETVMGIGNDANLFFSDAAPWAQMKQDPKLAEKTIAYSAVYVAILGVMFAPYLPTLSQKILSYFGSAINEDLMRKVYLGEIEALKPVFQNGFKLAVSPEGLVPKLDSKYIAQLEDDLKNKKVVE
ncbi:MAG: methionine--tRNA ligase [Bacteriovoracaceae bacterium]